MKFENIGGNARVSQYSLYDYEQDQNGVTVMSIEFNRETGEWWFVGKPLGTMTSEHMQALNELLDELLNKY